MPLSWGNIAHMRNRIAGKRQQRLSWASKHFDDSGVVNLLGW